MIPALVRRLFAALLLLTAAAVPARAQLFVGLGAFAHHYKDLGVFPGLQARVGFEANDGRFTADIGFNFSPVAHERSTDFSYSDPVNGATLTSSYTQRIKIQNLYLHGHINFGNDEQDFRVGVVAGFSVEDYSLKYAAKGNLPGGFVLPADTSYGGSFNVDFGLKANYRLGPGALFAQAIMSVPVSEESTKVPISSLTHYGLQAGYKLYFGNWRFNYTNRWR